MHWWSFAILAYLAIAIQLGLGAGVLGQFAPNLPLLACLFVALNARAHAALLGALFIGFGHDLISGSGIGAYAFFYALFALFVVQVRDVMYRRHPFTHLTLAVLMGLSVCVGMELREVIRGWLRLTEPTFAFWAALANAGVSVLIVIPIFALLQRYPKFFGFPNPHDS